MAPSTGFPQADAHTDFGRARRQQALAKLAAKLRREPDDVALILPFEEVVAALGRQGERRLGLQTIDLDSIVGHGRPQPRVRPQLPPDVGARPRALGADRARFAAGTGDAAD